VTSRRLSEPSPVLVAEIELGTEVTGETLPQLPEDYAGVLALVKLHGVPVGMVKLAGDELGIYPAKMREHCLGAFFESVGAHLSSCNEVLEDSTWACRDAQRAALSSAPYVTVIVPTRDRPERLRDCLTSVLGCDYPTDKYEILVVDNDSVDFRTRDVVEEIGEQSPVRYLYEPQSGSASARNRALPEAGGELLLFTDDDTIVDRFWMAELVTAYEDGIDAVTGLLFPRRLDTPARQWFEEYGGFSRGFVPRTFDLESGWPTDEPLYPFTAGIFGTGNSMSFRRSTLASIGGFDPALGNGTPALGGVDSEVLLRTVLLAHRLRYQPSAIAYHDHRADYDALKRQIFAYGSGLTAYYLKTITTNPRALPAFVAAVPRGLKFMLSSTSSLNSRKTATYPSELTRTELRGMLYGPIGYVKSRQKYGRHRPPKMQRMLRQPRGLGGTI
jgi:glycosyltransferase involved in cell wall biosynthesis